MRVSGSLSVINATNCASVNGNFSAGGFVGMIENVQNGDIVKLENCVNKGDISGYNHVGGVVGLLIGNDNISLLLKDFTNRGCISVVESCVGGFVGRVDSSNNTWITISHCINSGSVKGTPLGTQVETMFNDLGGFVGYIYSSHHVSLAITHSLNNGTVNGNDNCIGGLIGSLDRNFDINVSLLENVNDGTITGNANNGGFVGIIFGNNGINVTISRNTNNGDIVESGSLCGGFVGCVFENKNFVMTLSSNINNGSIFAKSKCAGGLIGFFNSPDMSQVFVFDDINKGSIAAQTEYACGFFCVSDTGTNAADITVFNSINKGNVNAPANAYGLTNILTSASHVVSMGDEIALSNAHTFWSSFSSVNSFFENKCSGCDSRETSFVLNKDTGMYVIVGESTNLHELLNDETKTNARCHKLWTSELELVDKLYVQVKGLFDDVFIIGSGETMKSVGNLS